MSTSVRSLIPRRPYTQTQRFESITAPSLTPEYSPGPNSSSDPDEAGSVADSVADSDSEFGLESVVERPLPSSSPSLPQLSSHGGSESDDAASIPEVERPTAPHEISRYLSHPPTSQVHDVRKGQRQQRKQQMERRRLLRQFRQQQGRPSRYTPLGHDARIPGSELVYLLVLLLASVLFCSPVVPHPPHLQEGSGPLDTDPRLVSPPIKPHSPLYELAQALRDPLLLSNSAEDSLGVVHNDDDSDNDDNDDDSWVSAIDAALEICQCPLQWDWRKRQFDHTERGQQYTHELWADVSEFPENHAQTAFLKKAVPGIEEDRWDDLAAACFSCNVTTFFSTLLSLIRSMTDLDLA